MLKFKSETTPGNQWGIKNSGGVEITREYLRRYIHCWCRIEDGFTTDRAKNIAYFMSDAFLNTCGGLTASQVGQKARFSTLWKRPIDSLTDAKAQASFALRTKAGIEEWEAGKMEDLPAFYDSGIMPEYAPVEVAAAVPEPKVTTRKRK